MIISYKLSGKSIGALKKKGLSVKKVMQNAIIGNDFDAICRLIRRNLVNPHTETFSGETALMRASYYGRLKEMELLLAMGSEVDYQEDRFSSGFTFTNPNEKGRCGCGESFHV